MAQFESSYLNYRDGVLETCLAENHAPAVKHTVITIEKAMGRKKRYFQLTTVMAAKQRANAHAMPRMSAKVAAGRPPSCHARIAANR
jgi:O-acetyl-ADP-ribose deacetylase (regulator of RNase III)